MPSLNTTVIYQKLNPRECKYRGKLLWYFYSISPRSHILNTLFSETYEWAQQAKVFVPGKHIQRIVLQHSSLLSPFAIFKEDKVL